VRIPQPRSSVHCELVALGLGLQLEAPLLISDSLVALQTRHGWGSWSTDRVLRCPDRREVWWLLALAANRPLAPGLEKVKAHDVRALYLGHPKAVGNDSADQAACRAASSSEVPLSSVNLTPYGVAVELRDATGSLIPDVRAAVRALWWDRRQATRSVRRPWLDRVYPPDLPLH
jgi:hypothetical protein